MHVESEPFKIGIDLGGTKISSIVIDADNKTLRRKRILSPQNNYQETLATLADLILQLQQDLPAQASIGIGTPGSISPHTGLIQNANSTWLNGKPLHKDLMGLTGSRIRFANDADCFALSEATDGAGKDYASVFGIIIGTGCGGGLVTNRQLNKGPLGTSGEWGHTPLPWPEISELKQNKCWCGQTDCMETWVSGPALSRDHQNITGNVLAAEQIADLAEQGDAEATNSLQRYTDRLARGLAGCINFWDPDIIVLGGGLSNIKSLYRDLPDLIYPYLFCDHKQVTIKPPVYGDDSGVRGAAWLWNTL